MYEGYWGFEERPFQNAPDPRFLYYSPAHEEALVRLLYAVSENKGLAVLSGEVGTGKTLISRVFRRELQARGYATAHVVNADLDPEDLIRTLLDDLGVPAGAAVTRGELWRRLTSHVQGAGGVNEAIIIIDEAQTISDARTFDTVRMLLNLVEEDRFLVTVILVGQPELRERVAEMPALRQRVGVACVLRPLTREETADYVAHRLRTAGGSDHIFTPDAVEALHQATAGIPRAVNTLADLALLAGSSAQAEQVDAQLIRQAAAEILAPAGGEA